MTTRLVGFDREDWWQLVVGVIVMAVSIGGAIYVVESREEQAAGEIAASDEEMTPPAVAPIVSDEIVVWSATVPVDIYDRSLGKVVVEVTMGDELLLISSTVLDDGERDTLLLCVRDGVVTIEGVADVASGVAPEMPEISGTGGAFSCVATDAAKGQRVTARLLNKSGEEQRVLVTAGLLRTHAVLLLSGHGAQNPYWDCDVRPGTAEEGMEGSTVGLWPRPVQDCKESWGFTGAVYVSSCPPPCP